MGGQISNTKQLSFDAPELYYIADSSTYEPLLATYCPDEDDDSTCVSPSCDRYDGDNDGCGLNTDGGYYIVLVGSNFGMSDADVQVLSEYQCTNSPHELATPPAHYIPPIRLTHHTTRLPHHPFATPTHSPHHSLTRRPTSTAKRWTRMTSRSYPIP